MASLKTFFYTLLAIVSLAATPAWAGPDATQVHVWKLSESSKTPVDGAAAASSTGAAHDAKIRPLDRFENDIKRFEEKDRANPPEEGAVVFVGSSSFTKWTDLESTFKEFHAINRGFGGSTIPEVNHYVSRIVSKYKPAKVVLYAGTNDIGELHHTGKQVFDDFKEFVKLVHAQLPAAQIYFVAMSVAPCRMQWERNYTEGNELIEDYVKTEPYLHYIDVTSVMRDKDGKLRDELFGPDHLHMTAEGYRLWTPIIRTALEAKS